MQPKPECFSCFLKQALIASRLAKKTENEQARVQMAMLRFLPTLDWKQNPPHIATLVFRKTYQLMRCRDPYLSVKKEYNRKVLQLYPFIRKKLGVYDPFPVAVKAALAGNIIDFGIFESFDLEGVLEKTMAMSLPKDRVRHFRARAATAKTILYIADNAGEIGFDRFLIEEIRRINPGAIIHFGVKGSPIINDATLADARYFKIDKVTRLIDSGAGWVGTHLRYCSKEFRKVFKSAELIISKGQANWESMEELHDPRIVFLLKAKCPVVAASLNVPLNETVIDYI